MQLEHVMNSHHLLTDFGASGLVLCEEFIRMWNSDFHGVVASQQIGSYCQYWWLDIQQPHECHPKPCIYKTIHANEGYQISLYVPDGWNTNHNFFFTLPSAHASRLVNASGFTRKIEWGGATSTSAANKLMIPLYDVAIAVVLVILLVMLCFALWWKSQGPCHLKRSLEASTSVALR